jgi:hypothetical protein
MERWRFTRGSCEADQGVWRWLRAGGARSGCKSVGAAQLGEGFRSRSAAASPGHGQMKPEQLEIARRNGSRSAAATPS